MQIYDVFLSYRRSDGTDLAQKTYDYLTSKGLRVFFDKEKMIDGKYFSNQIINNIINTPNYILIATSDVFKFRKGEDWVRKEIQLALDQYDMEQSARTFNVIIPNGSYFPSTTELPKKLKKLGKLNQIRLLEKLPNNDEFYRILKAISDVNARNLWNGIHRWFENTRNKEGRFEKLHIYESLLPYAKTFKNSFQHEFPIQVYQEKKHSSNPNKKNEEIPLLNVLANTKEHLYLIGQGGIGKTTALFYIISEAYKNKRYNESVQIPIFIELSRAPDTYSIIYDSCKSTFIRRTVYQRILANKSDNHVSSCSQSFLDRAFIIEPEIAVYPIDDLFTYKNDTPKYCLLLDGLNEASRTIIKETGLSVIQMLIQEILWILENCPNVRVLLTSRTNETEIRYNNITRFYLSGIKNDIIHTYLYQNGIDENSIESIFQDSSLLKVLHVPLFLTLYASLKKTAGITSRGEIFRTFFHEHQKNLEAYTIQKRALEIEENLNITTINHQPKRIDSLMQNFILDFLIPEIAWKMEQQRTFYLDIEDISEIIKPILNDFSDATICGRYGKKIFKKYRSGQDSTMHTKRIAKNIMNLGNNDVEETAEIIINCSVLTFGIMQENNCQYGFSHHYIRDYFSAVKNINSMKLAIYIYDTDPGLAFSSLQNLFLNPITPDICRFIGEFLGEHKNKPLYQNGRWIYNVPNYPCDRNLIERTIQLYRNKFNIDNGYGIYNLINILVAVRKDLSGINFSQLDLYNCILNGICLGRKGLGANFQGAKISSKTLFPIDDFDPYPEIFFSPTKKYLVTLNKGKAFIWNLLTSECVGILNKTDKYDLYIHDALYSPDGKIIITFGDTTKIWNSSTCEPILDLGKTNKLKYSPNKQFISAITDTKHIKIWNSSTFECIHILEDKNESGFKEYIYELTPKINYSWDSTHLITCTKKTKILVYNSEEIAYGESEYITKVWNLETFECIKIWEETDNVIYSSDNVHIITSANYKKEVKIWNNLICIDNIKNSMLFTNDMISKFYVTKDYTNKFIKIWNIENLEYIGGINDVDNICFSPNNTYFATWNRYILKIWNAYTFLCLAELIFQEKKYPIKVTFDMGEEYIAIVFKDVTIEVYDIKNLKCIFSIGKQVASIETATYSPNGQHIAIGSGDGTAKIWDTDTFNCTGTLNEPPYSTIFSIIYSMNGKRIITTHYDGSARVWNAETLDCIGILHGHTDIVFSVSYSPNGQQILTISDDGTAKIWNANTFKCEKELIGVDWAIYSPDGKYIASIYYKENFARLWDTSELTC